MSEIRRSLPLSALFFDCLYLEGQDLTDAPAYERFAALTRAVVESGLVTRLVTEDPDQAEAIFVTAVERGHEGLMAKSLEAPYEAGSRGRSWLKVKPAHTLDLVVLAAERGSGRCLAPRRTISYRFQRLLARAAPPCGPRPEDATTR